MKWEKQGLWAPGDTGGHRRGKRGAPKPEANYGFFTMVSERPGHRKNPPVTGEHKQPTGTLMFMAVTCECRQASGSLDLMKCQHMGAPHQGWDSRNTLKKFWKRRSYERLC